MSRWSFAFSAPLVLFGIGALLLAGWLGVLNVRRNRGRRAVLALEALRLLVVALAVVTLWRPELVRRLDVQQRPEVVVLSDVSRSMTTKDVVTENGTVESREDWVRDQRAAPFWGTLSNQYQVVFEEFGRPVAATNQGARLAEGTDLDGALEETLARHRRLRAIVLLTDGDWNLGKSPVVAATKLRLEDVPVFAVGVGSQEYLPDLALESVSAPAYGLLGEQVFIGFKVRSFLPREVRTTIALQTAQGTAVTKDLVIPANGQVQDALIWTPLAEGPTALTLRLPVEKDELRRDNNEQPLQIAIRKEVLRVLVVESVPRWEYRFLRNALSRDPGVEAECVLFNPGLQPSTGRGYLPAFPQTKEALSAFDVVFLGDVGIEPGELTAADAERLRGLVEQQGSGLVFLPGLRGAERSLAASPLGGLLPIEWDESDPRRNGSPAPAHLILTSRGQGHLLTMLAATPEQNAQVWEQLPGFYWHAGVKKTRPGAEVLAVHEGLRNQWGRLPLLVTRPAGNGKVLFLGIDSAWRWRRGVEDKYHYRFWGQVVRWMAYQRHLAHAQGIRLFYQPDNPQPGDKVLLNATVLDASGAPLVGGRVSAEIAAPGGRRERLELTPVDGGWGVYQGEFVPAQPGSFQVHLASQGAARKVTAEILVRGQQREQVGRPAQPDILREIASLTGGQFGQPRELAAVARRISALPPAEPQARRLRLWCHPAWGGLLLALLAVYWTGRKLAGMV